MNAISIRASLACGGAVLLFVLSGCSSAADTPPSGSAGAAGAASSSGGAAGSSGAPASGGAGTGGAPASAGASGSAGTSACDFGVDPWPNGAFVTAVVSFTPGPGAGFGADAMPCVVEGPPRGLGTANGSLDVVSLGMGGEIVLSFAPRAIVDGPGVDFIVFENAFYISGDPNNPYAEPGEVSVSDDGVTWHAFPCPTGEWKGQSCAGVHPVFASGTTGISPFDPTMAGGDPFDLATLGLTHARYVKIVDRGQNKTPSSAGFDLDAIAIVNAAPDVAP